MLRHARRCISDEFLTQQPFFFVFVVRSIYAYTTYIDLHIVLNPNKIIKNRNWSKITLCVSDSDCGKLDRLGTHSHTRTHSHTLARPFKSNCADCVCECATLLRRFCMPPAAANRRASRAQQCRVLSQHTDLRTMGAAGAGPDGRRERECTRLFSWCFVCVCVWFWYANSELIKAWRIRPEIGLLCFLLLLFVNCKNI